MERMGEIVGLVEEWEEEEERENCGYGGVGEVGGDILVLGEVMGGMERMLEKLGKIKENGCGEVVGMGGEVWGRRGRI